uniref:ABC transporter permease n=1 Tax=Pararhizobium sp. IMCC3301 TaxID=3067904 RepID=UPI0027405B70|nr:ABC transporter permease [Pararhizobium sp. IMCC3301]
MNQSLRNFRDYSISILGLLFFWWLASGPLQMPIYLLPSPADTFLAILELVLSGALWVHLGFTLQNLLLGLVTGTLAGVAVAYLWSRVPSLAFWLDGPMVIMQTAPKIALAPLFVVWFGFGVLSKVVLVFSLVFFPVFVSAVAGFKAIDYRLHDLSKLLDLSAKARFLHVELPSALPAIFIGMRIGAVQALVGAVLGEWMSGQWGLGYLMTYASATYQTPLLFAAVVLTVTLGILLHFALMWAENRLLSWKEVSND